MYVFIYARMYFSTLLTIVTYVNTSADMVIESAEACHWVLNKLLLNLNAR